MEFSGADGIMVGEETCTGAKDGKNGTVALLANLRLQTFKAMVIKCKLGTQGSCTCKVSVAIKSKMIPRGIGELLTILQTD